MDDRLKEALAVPCSGPLGLNDKCWWNQETGYTEYCAEHESIIADFGYGSKLADPVSISGDTLPVK